MSQTVIIDYESGNLRSAAKAFERVAKEEGLDTTVVVTSDVDQVMKADHIVLPGVGAYGDCMAGLSRLDGMIDALNECVHRNGRPFLGVCVGMQLMADRGLEHGETSGLGWISGDIVALEPADQTLKVPHMGWNELNLKTAHAVFDGICDGDHTYFVHSFHYKATNPDHILADVDYGGPVVSAVGRDNLVGTQFHPEKSQATGLKLIANFLKWKP